MFSGVYTGWFLAPAVALYTILFVVPVVMGLAYSLTNWNSMSDTVKFVGLANFQEIFTPNSPYLKSLYITLVYTLFTIVAKGGIGLALALLVNAGIRSKNALRGVYFLPQTLSPLIIGIVFVSVLSPGGVVNSSLRAFGLDSLTRNWLVDPKLGARFRHRRRSLAHDRLEHGDPAGGSADDPARLLRSRCARRRLLLDAAVPQITLPLLVPALTITTVLNTIHGLKTFDLIFALTGGGPGSLTEVLNIAVFHEFSIGRYGMATALGVVVFVITAVIALLIKNAMMRNVTEA